MGRRRSTYTTTLVLVRRGVSNGHGAAYSRYTRDTCISRPPGSWVAPHTRHSLLRVLAPSMENACTETGKKPLKTSKLCRVVVTCMDRAPVCAHMRSYLFWLLLLPAVRVRRAGRPRGAAPGPAERHAASGALRRQRGTALLSGYWFRPFVLSAGGDRDLTD